MRGLVWTLISTPYHRKSYITNVKSFELINSIRVPRTQTMSCIAGSTEMPGASLPALARARGRLVPNIAQSSD